MYGARGDVAPMVRLTVQVAGTRRGGAGVRTAGLRGAAGPRAGGLHSRTIEVLDQRGIADRFLSEGQVAQVAAFAGTPLDISDFPTRHPYALGLWQNHIERGYWPAGSASWR